MQFLFCVTNHSDRIQTRLSNSLCQSLSELWFENMQATGLRGKSLFSIQSNSLKRYIIWKVIEKLIIDQKM